MERRYHSWALLGAGLLALSLPGSLAAQQVHRNGFEGPATGWTRAGTDAEFAEKANEITDLQAHDGRKSATIALDIKSGSYVHYQYQFGRAPINEELSAQLWLKASRPGIQLLSRVVLPNELDPSNLKNPLTTTLRGDVYRQTGQWQRLALPRPQQLLAQQKQLMQAQFQRQLNFDGAYVDLLLLNLYAGPGPTTAWIDDLEIGPVVPDPQPTEPRNPVQGVPTNLSRPLDRNPPPDFKGNNLVVGKKRFLLHGVRFTDTTMKALRDAGFNAVLFDNEASDALLREAVDLGLWVAPTLAIAGSDGKAVSPDELTRQLNRYASNRVLFVRLPGILTHEQRGMVASAVDTLQHIDPSRQPAADVWDDIQPYSRILSLVGVHRWPLMTTMELPQYREWLDLRRRLANPGTFTWTWIQTHLPESYSQLLYEQPAGMAFKEPAGPQPEQIRLLTYSAIASGYRGLAYYSDRFLADSHQGRDRLLGCALLNQELDMLESLVVNVDDPPEWIDTSLPDVKAAVLRSTRGVLVLPMWEGKFAQLVPGQAAGSNMTMVVPQISASMHAWEVSPGEVRSLKCERVTGGTKIKLVEFGLTDAIVFTADVNLVAQLQDQARARRQLAAQWTYDMAQAQIEKVVHVQDQIEKLGQAVPDAHNLLDDARKRLQSAKTLWDGKMFAEAYHEGQRALRPLRILMRAQWEKAVRGLDSTVTSPYAVSYYTLPKHIQLMEQVRNSVPGQNLLPSGDFEVAADRPSEPWQLDDRPPLDDVELVLQRVGKVVTPDEAKSDVTLKGSPYLFNAAPKEGKRCALLQIRPKGLNPPPLALDRTLLKISSPPVHADPGSLVQISGWVSIPTPIRASPDGALFYESSGGEPMAIRLTGATGWKKFTVYRRVPANGQIQVTLALTGLGTVLFDDVRIEPLLPANATSGVQPVSLRPAGPR